MSIVKIYFSTDKSCLLEQKTCEQIASVRPFFVVPKGISECQCGLYACLGFLVTCNILPSFTICISSFPKFYELFCWYTLFVSVVCKYSLYSQGLSTIKKTELVQRRGAMESYRLTVNCIFLVQNECLLLH